MNKIIVVVVLLFSLSIPAISAPDSAMEKEVNCLAQNIYYEARGEPEEGKLMVGYVTINRTANDSFPDTVCGVVHQKNVKKKICQFSWACMFKRPTIKYDSEAWEESYKIAVKLLLFEEKPVIMSYRKALYFHANYVKPGWTHSKKFLKRVGTHMFYSDKPKT